MIKLVASDLDGTIIDKNNFIYENNFNAIKDLTKNNMNFVVCTGKTYHITKDLCSKINASYGIFCNGSQIIDLKTGKEIYNKLLPTSDVLTCIDIAKKHNLHAHIYTNNEVISENLLYLDLRNYKLQTSTKTEVCMEFKIVDDLRNYIATHDLQICKLVLSSMHSTANVKNEILGKLNVSATTISKFGPYKDCIIDKEYEYLDICSNGVNKDTALQILGNYLNIKSTEMLAIGDNLNDFDMIKNAGIGVAVANAYDPIKQIANYTTTNPVEKGGFAEAIYKFIQF